MTLCGKVSIIKMIVTPQIVCMCPSIPEQLLVKYVEMINQFLLNVKKKKNRIRIDKLCESKKRGGLSLPNIKHCNISFEMAKL